MIKRFIHGLVFGTGFGLAFVAILYIGVTSVILPQVVGPEGSSFSSSSTTDNLFDVSVPKPERDSGPELKIPFGELSLEDQIRHSSAIAIAEYKLGTDGKVSAIISDVLKIEEGTTFYYEVGDEYHDASYYPRPDRSYGDGVVIFFTGSPASMRMSMTYSGDRIGSLGDIPIKLLREKCAKPNA
jgi:hypothetical protein